MTKDNLDIVLFSNLNRVTTKEVDIILKYYGLRGIRPLDVIKDLPSVEKYRHYYVATAEDVINYLLKMPYYGKTLHTMGCKKYSEELIHQIADWAWTYNVHKDNSAYEESEEW